MEKQQLQEALTKLHGELSEQQQLDDSTRQLLRKFADDIDRLLDDNESATGDVDSPSEQVQDLVLKFEADHPKLTAALNQIASALANMGI